MTQNCFRNVLSRFMNKIFSKFINCVTRQIPGWCPNDLLLRIQDLTLLAYLQYQSICTFKHLYFHLIFSISIHFHFQCIWFPCIFNLNASKFPVQFFSQPFEVQRSEASSTGASTFGQMKSWFILKTNIIRLSH